MSVTQLCLTICDPMNCSLPGSSIHGILQARTLKWVAMSFSMDSSWPGDQTQVSCISCRFFTIWVTLVPTIKFLEVKTCTNPCKPRNNLLCKQEEWIQFLLKCLTTLSILLVVYSNSYQQSRKRQIIITCSSLPKWNTRLCLIFSCVFVCM